MVDYEKLGELIDGYDGISADDLGALPEVDDSDGASLVGSLGRENAKLRAQLCDLRLERGNYINDEMARLRADDLHALPSVADTRDEEIALLKDENKRLREALADVEDENKRLREALADVEDENKRLREALADVEDENKRLREALAEVELILTSLPSRILPAGINDGVGDVLGRWPA